SSTNDDKDSKDEQNNSKSDEKRDSKDNQRPPERQVKEEDLQGKPWQGLGENKAFKQVEVKQGDEKYDTNYTWKEGEVVKNDQDAKFKTNLSDVKLAKPEADNGEEKQEIPLEYKDILR